MIIKNQCLNPISVPSVTGTTLRVLRCGHCANCIRQKKNELAVRTYREFYGQSFCLLTFTYDDEHVPIQVTDISVGDDGESVSSSYIKRGDSEFFSKASFDWKTNKDGKKSKRYKPLITDTDNGMQVKYYSVYYEDLKLVLKRFRIKHPSRLHQFIAVPEYGSLTYRPHYHLMALGLTDDELKDFASEWKYGSVDVDNGRNPKRENSPSKIAQYIAKYCVKGKYDCPYISDGYCIKPRRSVSKNFGLGYDWQQFKSVLYCTRELGITNPFMDVDLTDKQISLLISRRKFTVNDFDYVLPKYLVNKAFKRSVKSITYENPITYERCSRAFNLDSESHRVCNSCLCRFLKEAKIPKEVHYHLVSSPLQNKIANYILADLVSDACKKRESLHRSFKSSCEAIKYYDNDEAYREKTIKKFDQYYISQLESSSIY